MRKDADAAQRLTRLLLALWRDLPRASKGFANNVMQAVSTSGAQRRLQPAAARAVPGPCRGLDSRLLNVTPREAHMIAGVVLMAFDGFAMNVRLAHGVVCNADIAQLFSSLLSGTMTSPSLEPA